MKKTTLTVVAILMAFVSFGQLSIYEGNIYASEDETIPGIMGIRHQELLPKVTNGHLVWTVLGVYEAFMLRNEKTVHALRAHTGLGYANKKHTLALGVMYGAGTDEFPEIKGSVSFWAFAETGKITFQTIYIDWEAYLFEVGYRVSDERAKTHFSVLLANHGPNWGIGGEIHHIKSGFYAFVSPTIRWYEMQKNSHGEVQDVFVVNPTQSPFGVHAAIGKKFAYKKSFSPKVEE